MAESPPDVDALALDDLKKLLVEVAVPEGSRFKGYHDIIVQELQVSRAVMLYRRQRWQPPDGSTVVAPLPSGIKGQYGPELRRFVLAQYHQGQSTVERLVTLLRERRIEISKRQLIRLLNAGKQSFVAEAEGVLQAGLETAGWVTVDDTGARHAASKSVRPCPAACAGYSIAELVALEETPE